MKIYESWKRNQPDTMTGESITLTFVYSSFDKKEIDEIEQMLPNGMVIIDTEKENVERYSN